jgi:hypothetical protein
MSWNSCTCRIGDERIPCKNEATRVIVHRDTLESFEVCDVCADELLKTPYWNHDDFKVQQ